MVNSYQPYLDSIRGALQTALCLQNFPCQLVERHNKPEVEFGTSKELLLKPITICRNEHECCLIETSINSVRISFKVKATDQLEALLNKKFMAFLMQRAEPFGIMRRVALPGYDISFMLTNFHCDQYQKDKLIDFVCHFVEDINTEVVDLKLLVNTRARAVAAEFLRTLSANA
eukprot:jgi/Astpho2/7847/e_gw1.00117.112.1_t